MRRIVIVLGGLVALGFSVVWAWPSFRRTEPTVSASPAIAVAPAKSSTPMTVPAEPTPGDGAGRVAVPQLLAQLDYALSVNGDAERESILNDLFPALIVRDRAAAARFAESVPAGDLHELLLRRVARAWAAADFAGAVAWIASLPEAGDRKAAFEDACFEAAVSRPAEVIRAWEALEFTADDHVLENLVQSWAAKDLAAARAWVAARPPSLQRDQAVARVAYVMAQSSPADAARYVVLELPPGPAQTEAAISVLQQWTAHDLAGATAWVEQFPPGPLADRARHELAGIAP